MPDAQNDESRAMHRVANDVFAKDEITNRIRFWSLRNATPHRGECAKAVNACDEISSDASGGGRIVVGDEVS